jgi:hypothetical protein
MLLIYLKLFPRFQTFWKKKTLTVNGTLALFLSENWIASDTQYDCKWRLY